MVKGIRNRFIKPVPVLRGCRIVKVVCVVVFVRVIYIAYNNSV